MDTNCIQFYVDSIAELYDSAEYIFDILFKFVLEHQDYFGEKMFKSDNSRLILSEIRKAPCETNISECPKNSILTWSADKALSYITTEFEKEKYPAATFPRFLDEYADQILKAGESEKPNGICLAALIYSSALPEHTALKQRLGSELFETFKEHPVNEWVDILAAANPPTLKGPENEFINALNNVNYISNTWDHMKIADLSHKLKPTNAKISDKEFFEIYGGNYSLIPKNSEIDPAYYSLSESEKNSIVIDPKEQDYVKAFLISNFDKFHQLLTNSSMIVYKQLKNANINNFNNEVKKYSSKLSYYSSDYQNLENMFKSVQHIHEKYNVSYLSDVVDAIIHSYIPIIQRFQKSRVYNNSLASVMVSSGNNSLLLGASVYLQQPMHIPSYSETKLEPETKYIDRYVNKYINSINCGLLGGNESEFTKNDYNQDTVTTKHFKKLIEIQKKFNRIFMEEYRKFIDVTVNISDSVFKSYELAILQDLIGQFNKVLIRDAHTVVKLTGVTEKHFGNEYIKTCEGLIKILVNRKMTAFDPLIPIIQNIIKACKEALEASSKAKDEYFLAKKSPIDYDAYDLLVKQLENTYIPFTKEDSIKVSDTVARFRDFLTSKVVPKGDLDAQTRLKGYISKMNDRNEAINRYFNERMQANKYYGMQQYTVSSNKILKPLIDMANTILNENRKAYIWLNEKVDAFEVNDRIKQLSNRTFTEEELNKIANAYVEFSKYSKLNANKLGVRYKTFVNYQNKNVCSFFKCYQLARETIEEVGSVNYLERLYSILGIIDTSSKEWADFKVGLISYLALSLVWFDVYKYSNNNNIESWVEIDRDQYADYYDDLTYLNQFKELRRGRTYELFEMMNDILTGDDNVFGNICDQANILNLIRFPVPPVPVAPVAPVGPLNGPAPVSQWTLKLQQNHIDAINTGINNARYQWMFSQYGTALAQIIETKSIMNPRYVVGFSLQQKHKVGPFDTDDNPFYTTVLKSLFLPVIQQLDKYIRVRYTGTLRLDTTISKLMMGGDSKNSDESIKQEAGNIYDHIDQHYEEKPEVIPEAFKFYISAYAILKYYFEQLEYLKNHNNSTLTVAFNERSNFYSLKESGNEIRLMRISASEYSLRKFLKIMNKYYSSTSGDIETRTTKAIEMICSEFNNLIVFGDINEMRRIREGQEHEIDLEKQVSHMTQLQEDLNRSISNAMDIILKAGIQYDSVLKAELAKGYKEISTNTDKYGVLKKWIDKVDNQNNNVESEDRKLFIDAFLTPLIVISDYWYGFFTKMEYLPRAATAADKAALISRFSSEDMRPYISALIKYGKNSAKTVGDILDLSLEECYQDIDNAIHHILGYKNYNESVITMLVNNVHDNFKTSYENIKNFFNSRELADVRNFDIMNYISISIPAFTDEYIRRNLWEIGKVYTDSYVKFKVNNPTINTITFTKFVTTALSRLSIHKYLPQFYVDALKGSLLLNNTFTEIRTMGTGICIALNENPDRVAGNKEILYTEEIIDDITSCTIYWSSSPLSVETDSKVASQSYKNKIVSTIPILLYILQSCYNRIDAHHENYTITSNKNRTITINAKSEITILMDILKALYAEFLPVATKMAFMNNSNIPSDHYLCEVRNLIEHDKLGFVDILENPEKFEWILPAAKINPGVEYLESDRFGHYLTLIKSVTIDADFGTSWMEVLQTMSKTIVYNIIDSIDYSLKQVDQTAFMGGNIENNIINGNSNNDNNIPDPEVIPKMKKLNVKVNNEENNLIASEINNSRSLLKTKLPVNYKGKGQLITTNQKFAALLYEQCKKQTLDFKLINFDILIETGFINAFNLIRHTNGAGVQTLDRVNTDLRITSYMGDNKHLIFSKTLLYILLIYVEVIT